MARWTPACAGMTVLVLLTTIIHASQKITLFDGESLNGWHNSGDGEWSVVDGTILGRNPSMDWNHLVSDDSGFTDFYATLKWKNITGNTGLYFRTKEGGTFGVSGLQVELGSDRDGSIMWVTESAFDFETDSYSQAANEGLINAGEWNTLEVEVSENSYKTTINGTLIIDNPSVAEMVNPAGALALQLHSGANNEVYFKDIEVYIPTRITGCGDSAFTEYDSLVNDPDSGACLTLSGDPRQSLKKDFKFSLNKSNLIVKGIVDPGTVRIYSLAGNEIKLFKKAADRYVFARYLVPGIYFIQFKNHGFIKKTLLTE